MNACSQPRCDINCCLECASLTKCDACGEGTCKFCREEGYIKTCDHCNRTLCLKCCTTRYCYCPYDFCSGAICIDCHPVGWECTWCSEYTEYSSDKYEKYAPRCTQCFANAKTHCNGCGRKKLRDEDYSAPPVPSSYWISLGYDEANVERMEKFLQEVKLTTLKLRSGEELECGITLKGGCLDPNGLILRHDNILLPHWQEFANALRQYTHEPGYHDVFRLSDVELHSSVVDMLTLALKQKNKPLEVHNCPSSTNGIDFAVKYAQSNPGLKRLHWGGTRVDTTEILRRLFDIVDSHPSLNSFSLDSICGERMNGHDLLPLAFSLLHGTKTYNIGLRSNNIRTNGATDLPDFVATNNPHLKRLDLMDNNFDDGDALLLAKALSRNNALERIDLRGNNITEVGSEALLDALCDCTSVKSVVNSNHTCTIYGLGLDYYISNCDSPPQKMQRIEVEQRRIGRKIYYLFSTRNSEGSNGHHLELEFGDISLELSPHVLERVMHHSPQKYGAGSLGYYSLREDVCLLSILYEMVRSWNLPVAKRGKRSSPI